MRATLTKLTRYGPGWVDDAANLRGIHLASLRALETRGLVELRTRGVKVWHHARAGNRGWWDEQTVTDARARQEATRDAELAKIAAKHTPFATLDHRSSGEDFQEVSSWSLKAALEDAYAAGQAAAAK